MSWSLPIRLAAAALVLLGAPWLPMARADYRQATLKDFADIYSGPGEDYYVVEDGEEGNSFPVLQEKGEWVKIRLSTGTGWVEASKVEITTVEGEELPPAAGERAEEGAATEQGAPGGGIEAVVKVKTAKLLSEPSSSAIVVKKLPKGSRVEVVERSRDGKWYKVRYDGPIAWLLASSVRLVGLEAGAESKSIPTLGDESFRLMNEAELRQASSELGHELRLWAGVGVARLRQRWDTNATGGYRFESYKPPFEYDNSTPGPALNLGAACWFSPNWGAQASSRLVVAYKGLEFSDPAYTSDPVRLTLATYSLDLAGQLRFPFLRPGAFFHGRFGYRYFQLDWDQAQPDPQEIKGAQSPLYWSTIYQGPFLGLGMRYPFAGWIGVEGSADVVPYAFARNTVVGGTTQTPSGDVTRAWGFTGEVQVWLLISQGPPTISAEVRFFYDYYWSHFVVPEGADAPRASAPYRAYSDATGDEQAGGCAVAMSIRF